MSGEKRSQDNGEDAQRDEKIIIVDIEGTTTSISFVKDTLFPYVRNNLKEYIEKNWENAEFKEDVKKLKEQATKDAADKVEGLVAITDATVDDEKESLMKNVIWQMDNDRKTGALKQLQGHMWREAYKSGAVKGHVYEDVPKSFEAWTKAGRKIYVYSSGSVEAQKLLFENSEKGDLLKYLTDYFDTEVGVKQQASSYTTILKKIDTDGKNVLFLTDIPNEAKAAIEAGLSSIIVIRDGNTDLTVDEKSTYTTIKSFDDLSFNVPTKRAKVEESTETEKKNTEKTDKVDDVEMKDVSDVKDDDKKSTDEKVLDAKTTNDEAKNDTAVKTDDEIEKTKETEKPKESEKIDEPIVKASTSDEKMETETVEKKVVDDVKKTDKNIKSTDEKVEKIIVETEEKKSNTETDDVKKSDTDKDNKTETENVKKTETDKTNNETLKPETSKTDDKKKDEKEEEEKLAEQVKNEDKKTDDKAATVAEEVKQNGDSKVAEKKETDIKVTNGNNKTELNGNTTKKGEIVVEKNETEVTGEVEKKIDDAKIDTVKDDEKTAKDEQQVNGNSVNDAKEKNHRNGVNEEKSKNGESSTTDVESIKVKKVVEKIADGAGEADVTPPVAVVAASS